MSDQGGTAFPFDNVEGRWGNGYPEPGMTLRDYFAAKAMQSLVHAVTSNGLTDKVDSIPVGAYEIADAMLKARKS